MSFFDEDDIHKQNNYKRTSWQQLRRWFGTVWLVEDIEYLKSLNYKYLIISALDYTSHEQAHYHVLILFNHSYPRPKTKNAHWEPAKKISACLKYIKDKGDLTFEDGELQLSNKDRDDWSGFLVACKNQSPREIIDGPYSMLYAKYRMFAGEVHCQFANISVIDGELHNLWLWGEPRTGKTRYAWDNYPDLFVKDLNKWWDGYHGQEVVLLDDWDPKQEILVQKLKIWADRYPFRAETKGSSMMIRPKMIIVTSNYSINDCFKFNEDVAAIRSRFKVMHFLNFGQAPINE